MSQRYYQPNSNTSRHRQYHNHPQSQHSFLDYVAEWARRSEARQISTKNHNPRDESPDWESTFGMDFSWCSRHHLLIPNVGLRFENEFRNDGCTCPSSTWVTLDMLQGPVDGSVHGILSRRETWLQAYRALKKPTSNGQDRLSSPVFHKQQGDEFVAWIKLWNSVWELANKRRYHMHDEMSDETHDDGDAYNNNWTEEEQECLITHREDVLERGAISKIKALAYCFSHNDVGDSLPVRQPNRYKNCGFCILPEQESEDTKRRYEMNQSKKQQSEFTKMVECGIIKPDQVLQYMRDGNKLTDAYEQRELKLAQMDAIRKSTTRPVPRENRKRREPTEEVQDEENDYSFLYTQQQQQQQGNRNNNNNTMIPEEEEEQQEELKSDNEDMRWG